MLVNVNGHVTNRLAKRLRLTKLCFCSSLKALFIIQCAAGEGKTSPSKYHIYRESPRATAFPDPYWYYQLIGHTDQSFSTMKKTEIFLSSCNFCTSVTY